MKVKFTLSIGLAGCRQEEEFTLEDLGYGPGSDGDIDKFLEDVWREWIWNYIDGGWEREEA